PRLRSGLSFRIERWQWSVPSEAGVFIPSFVFRSTRCQRKHHLRAICFVIRPKPLHPSFEGQPMKVRLFAVEPNQGPHRPPNGHSKKQQPPPKRHRMLLKKLPIPERVAIALRPAAFVEDGKQPRMTDVNVRLVLHMNSRLQRSKHQVIIFATPPEQARPDAKRLVESADLPD